MIIIAHESFDILVNVTKQPVDLGDFPSKSIATQDDGKRSTQISTASTNEQPPTKRKATTKIGEEENKKQKKRESTAVIRPVSVETVCEGE